MERKRRICWGRVLGAAILAGTVAFGALLFAPRAGQGHGGIPTVVKFFGKTETAQAAVSPPDRWESPPEPVGPTFEEKAQALLDGMTLEEKVGQLFIARCPEKDAVGKAEEYYLGGYILFRRDFEGKTWEEAAAYIQNLQSLSEIPLLIGVDEEGGIVNRVSANPSLRAAPFLSPQDLYVQGGFERIQEDTREKCRLLKGLGINLNFAPVCDVSQNPADFIYSRSFGMDAAQTADYVKTVVEVMGEEGMGCVLKHFPGYGDNGDTHTGIVRDSRPYGQFIQSDFLPFQAGIAAGGDMVLISHNIVAAMDPEYPASLSPEVHRILREELGFTGVIITDDLVMKGIRNFIDDGQAAVFALLAGNDLLCSTDFERQIPALLKAVEEGLVSEERVDQSVLRILTMKWEMGLFRLPKQ